MPAFNLRNVSSSLVTILAVLLLASCGGGSGSPPDENLSLTPITISGIATELGNFDPAPTRDSSGNLWMSYSHVSQATSGIKHIETRLATSADAGANWQDAGILVNAATTLPLPSPNDINAVANEVSRLIYNPYAPSGSDPWILLWHRYLSVYDGSETLRLFEHGWIGMKSGPTANSLTNERKLFTGSLYDTTNNSDALGPPEYPLASLWPASTALGDCVAFSEPGVLAKSNGLYVAMLCAKATPPGKIVLLRCDHDMNGCTYQGDLLQGNEAITINPAYNGYSAAELVNVGGQDYLIVTPTTSNSLYRGCVVYKIIDLDAAQVERSNSLPLASHIIPADGDFNGACGYVAGLTGSGIMMSEAFFTGNPVFRLFGTGLDL